MLFLKRAEIIKKKAEKQYNKRLKKKKKEQQKYIKQLKHKIIKNIKMMANKGSMYAYEWVQLHKIIYLTPEEKNTLKNYFTSKGYTIETHLYKGDCEERWDISWAEKREGEV